MDQNYVSNEDSTYNERGIIADNYRELQAVHLLEQAKNSSPLSKATYDSTLQANLQSVEIALLNLEDLMQRATHDVADLNFDIALRKLSWARGFHRVLVHLSGLPSSLLSNHSPNTPKKVFSINQSPAFQRYFKALQSFDQTFRQVVLDGALDVKNAIATESIDSTTFHLIHLVRICNHDASIWEQNLSYIVIPTNEQNYEDFVMSDAMFKVVHDRNLVGDTFFLQFRGLHQIPEVLCAEMNDRIEEAIIAVRKSHLILAYEHLHIVNMLGYAILPTLPAIFDNLSTFDYHQIRENLGLTSGSHSTSLHYHLFRDLYTQLVQSLESLLITSYPDATNIGAIVYEIDTTRLIDNNSFVLYQYINECLTLRDIIHQWRNWHLHLPRNNLGGNNTKSLTGANDAVAAVRRMRDVADSKDPMHQLLVAKHVRGDRQIPDAVQLNSYFAQDESLDNMLLNLTGEVTQEGFREVQERLGVFANKPPFTPPPKRKV